MQLLKTHYSCQKQTVAVKNTSQLSKKLSVPAGTITSTIGYRSGSRSLTMIDHNGRKIDYLRISVTDRCNLRCKYCMPDGIRSVPMSQILTFEEILAIVRETAAIGIRCVRLTGGEPLVRLGMPDLVRKLKRVPGIEKVTMTTNGILLQEYLPALTGSGLDAVNISLDTMDRAQYRAITGTDGLDTVLRAISAACASGLRVKVNAVSLALGEDNIRALIALAKDLPVDIRFIEMMPIGYGRDFPVADSKDRIIEIVEKEVRPKDFHEDPEGICRSRFGVVDHRTLLNQLQRMYPGMKKDDSVHGFGPAVYYSIPGYRGSLGLISAIHGKFCDSCNRVRLTSQGFLKTCLCYDEGTDLRAVLRSGLPEGEMHRILRERLYRAIYEKPDAHCFEMPEKITEKAGMSAIGG